MKNNEKILYKGNPAMFRNHPIFFLIFMVLILAYGIGLIFLIIWWINVKRRKLIITNRRVRIRNGILKKNINEIKINNIRNVQTSQSFFQRIFSVGKVSIASAATDKIEMSMGGIRNPQKIKELIV